MLVKVGQSVSVNDPQFPGVWKVKSVGPVNALLEPITGGRGLRAPKDMLIPPTNEPLKAQEFVYFTPGEIVEIGTGKYKGTYIVLADKGAKVNVALLGGDGGRYVRAGKAQLKKVNLTDLLYGVSP